MEMTIGSLKRLIAESIGETFKHVGVAPDKTNTWYTAKEGKRKVAKVFVATYNYLPNSIEFSFIFQLFIPEIDEERKKLCIAQGIDYQAGPTFTIAEGFFYHKLASLSPKHKNAFSHVIKSDEDISSAISDANDIIKKELIPQLVSLFNLESFQKWVSRNMEIVGSSPLLLPALIASRLSSSSDFLLTLSVIKSDQYFQSLPESDFIKKSVLDYENYYS